MNGTAALDALRSLYAQRHSVGDRLTRDGHTVVGHIGPDVPRAWISAAGAIPVRVPTGRMPAPLGAELLGAGVDRDLHPVVDAVWAGRAGRQVVVDHSSDGTIRAFQALCWLSHHRARPPAVDVHLVDLLALDRASTHAYNARQLEGLRVRLGEWLGRRPSDHDLMAAHRDEEDARSLLADVLTLRTQANPVLSGSDALAVIGAYWTHPATVVLPLLRALRDAHDDLSRIAGVRVLMTGSSHGDRQFYEALERGGLFIVGEDHDWGDRVGRRHRPTGPDAAASVLAIHHASPASPTRSGSDRRVARTIAAAQAHDVAAVISLVRSPDPGPAWDRGPLARALGRPLIPVDIDAVSDPATNTVAAAEAVLTAVRNAVGPT